MVDGELHGPHRRHPVLGVLDGQRTQVEVQRQVADHLDDVGVVGVPACPQFLRCGKELLGHGVERVGEPADRIGHWRVHCGRFKVGAVQHPDRGAGAGGTAGADAAVHLAATTPASAWKISAVDVAPGS